MKRLKILWLGFILGGLLGLIFYSSFLILDNYDGPENIKNIMLYLISVPGIFCLRLDLSAAQGAPFVFMYWALIGWLFCAILTIQSKFRYAVLIMSLILLAVIHRDYMILTEQELECLSALLESLFKGTY